MSKKICQKGDGICDTSCWLCQSPIQEGQTVAKYKEKWRHSYCMPHGAGKGQAAFRGGNPSGAGVRSDPSPMDETNIKRMEDG